MQVITVPRELRMLDYLGDGDYPPMLEEGTRTKMYEIAVEAEEIEAKEIRPIQPKRFGKSLL
jgi:hypothetical protein